MNLKLNVLDPTFGIASALAYDGLKKGKELVGPGFYGVLVETINETEERFPGITSSILVEFFGLPEIEKRIKEFQEGKSDIDVEPFVLKFEELLKNKSIEHEPKEVLSFFLQKIEDQRLSKPGMFEKIELRYLRRIETHIESVKTETIKAKEEILKAISEGTIQNEFDLQKLNQDQVMSNLGQICKTMNKSDPNWNYQINLSEKTTELKISPKIKDRPLMFKARIKFKNEKEAKTFEDIVKNQESGKITFNPEDIEEIKIYDENKTLYSLDKTNLKTAELRIVQNKPKPILAHLKIENCDLDLDYLILKGKKSKNGDLILDNFEQKNYPWNIELQMGKDNKSGNLAFKAKDANKTMEDANNINKIVTAISKGSKLRLIDAYSEQTITEMRLTQSNKIDSEEVIKIIAKAAEIQKITGIILPFPPEIISKKDIRAVLETYEIVTKGKITGRMSSNIILHKNEPAFQPTIKNLKKFGMIKNMKFSSEQTVTIFGVSIALGLVEMVGDVTTEEPPLEIVEKLEKLEDGGTISVKFSTFGENQAEFTYSKWLK